MQIQNINLIKNYKNTNIPFGKIKDLIFLDYYKNFGQDAVVDCFIRNKGNNTNISRIIKIGNEKKKVKTINETQYFIYNENGEETASMKLRFSGKNEFYFSDEFYKKTKNGPIVIEEISAKNKSERNFLISEAVKFSKHNGSKGCIVINAKNTSKEYESCPSEDGYKAYNLNIPASYIRGFRAIDREIEEKIRQGMQSLNYYGAYNGPRQAYMYLPKDRINFYLKKSKHFNYNL